MDLSMLFKIIGVGVGSYVAEEIFESRGDSRLATAIKVIATIIIMLMVLSAISDLINQVKSFIWRLI